MNKKGFTLVEILAVIVLIGAVMLLIIPNITKNFKDAQKELFYDNLLKIYTEATNTYLVDNSSRRFCVGSDTTIKTLNIDNSEFYYDVEVDSYGSVKSIRVANDDYYFYLNKTGMKKSDLNKSAIQSNGLNVYCDDSTIAYDLTFTDYTLDGASTNTDFATLYSALGTDYDAEVSCRNGSVFTYSNGKIDLEELSIPDYCTVNFITK